MSLMEGIKKAGKTLIEAFWFALGEEPDGGHLEETELYYTILNLRKRINLIPISFENVAEINKITSTLHSILYEIRTSPDFSVSQWIDVVHRITVKIEDLESTYEKEV